MPERDLRGAYWAGFGDGVDAVMEIVKRNGRGAEHVLKDVKEFIEKVRTEKARKILEDLTR